MWPPPPLLLLVGELKSGGGDVALFEVVTVRTTLVLVVVPLQLALVDGALFTGNGIIEIDGILLRKLVVERLLLPPPPGLSLLLLLLNVVTPVARWLLPLPPCTFSEVVLTLAPSSDVRPPPHLLSCCCCVINTTLLALRDGRQRSVYGGELCDTLAELAASVESMGNI